MANTIEIIISVTNKGSKNLNAVEKSISGLSGVTKVATGIFAGLTAGLALAVGGLVAFGASAVKEGAAYSKAMSNVKAITGATAVEFEALSASAELLGRTTKFTATEAAEGMSFLAMAGFEVNEVISAMPGVLNLAAAGNLKLGQSADIVSNVLTGFGAEADQTGRFVDVLTKTFTSSNTNLIQLGQAMKFVAPVAADLGLSVEQTAAAMGVLGDGGIQASMAGTTLRTTLLNLAAPVGKGKALIEELGIEVFDAAGKMLPFPEIIGNFNDAMAGMSDAQRESTLRTIIGKRAISGFSLLLKKGEKGLVDFGNELLNSGGTAAEIAATQLDNLTGDMTLFKSALSGIKIDVFKALEPVLRGIVSQAKVLLDRFGPQLKVALDTAIGGVTAFVNKVTGAFQKFGVRGAAISILGMLGLGADQIANILAVGDQIGAAIQAVFDIVNEVIAGFQEGGVGGAFGALFSPELAGTALQGVIDFISQFLADNWPIVQAQLTEWGNMFFNWVNETVVPVIPDVLSAIVVAITSWASEQLPIIQAATQDWATGFWDWIQDVVSSAGESLAGIVASIGLWAQSGETQSQLTAMGFELGEAIALGLQNMAENQDRMVEILTQVVTGLGVAALAVTGLLIAIGAQILAGIIAGIIGSITGGEVEVAMISNLTTILSDIASQVVTIASLIGTNIILGISQGILDSIGGLTTTVEQIGTIIIETVSSMLGISSPSTLFFGFGVSIIQGLIDGILSLAGSVTETIGGILGNLFGGGEEAPAPAMAFDPAEMLTGIETVNVAIANMDLSLNNISLTTLPLLSETFLVITTSMMEQLLLLLTTGIMPIDLALMSIITITLPTLQATVLMVAAASIAALSPVLALIVAMEIAMASLTASTIAWGAAITKAGAAAAKGFAKAASALRGQLIPAMRNAVSVAEALAASLRKVSSASRRASKTSRSMGGAGFAQGLGFQAGTPSNTNGLLGLGFKIPSGFPNDTFGPMFAQSGEEMLITPRGLSIEDLVFSRLNNLIGTRSNNNTTVINNFTQVINTKATQSPREMANNFRVAQGMIGT